tara:strand:+ start:364 stop:705 length:342 start_codon:yes stop_codon:yes gene_type:complete
MEIINHNNCKSLYSTQSYQHNQIIYKLSGPIVTNPTRTSIEIGPNQHIENKYGQCMNHSFHPTCKIENGCIVACQDIDTNTELTFNYNETETNMSHPFVDNETNKMVSGKKKI